MPTTYYRRPLTRHRHDWMRDYMREYRQGKLRGTDVGRDSALLRCENLKVAHRFTSFKWRFSKLLSPQYQILVCIQYAQQEYHNKDLIPDWSSVDENTILEVFPELSMFQHTCKPGGEIFKLFVFSRFNKKHDQITLCVIGVLDKSILLKYRQKILDYYDEEWDFILDWIAAEESMGIWSEFGFSKDVDRWLGDLVMCSPLRWTIKNSPNWRSVHLRNLLNRWQLDNRKIGTSKGYAVQDGNDTINRGQLGNRRIGKWKRGGVQDGTNAITKQIWSPILLGS
jgi:hypothetical protein